MTEKTRIVEEISRRLGGTLTQKSIMLEATVRTEDPYKGMAVVRIWTVPGKRYVDYPPDAADAFAEGLRHYAQEARDMGKTMAPRDTTEEE